MATNPHRAQSNLPNTLRRSAARRGLSEAADLVVFEKLEAREMIAIHSFRKNLRRGVQQPRHVKPGFAERLLVLIGPNYDQVAGTNVIGRAGQRRKRIARNKTNAGTRRLELAVSRLQRKPTVVRREFKQVNAREMDRGVRSRCPSNLDHTAAAETGLQAHFQDAAGCSSPDRPIQYPVARRSGEMRKIGEAAKSKQLFHACGVLKSLAASRCAIDCLAAR